MLHLKCVLTQWMKSCTLQADIGTWEMRENITREKRQYLVLNS